MPTWYDKAKSDELLATKAASSHTHTSSQVTDLPETVRDTIATALVAGTNVTITPNDAGDTITIDAAGGGGGSTDPEVVRDTIASALVAGANVTITPDDTANTITIAATGGGGGGGISLPAPTSRTWYNATSGGTQSDDFAPSSGRLYAVPLLLDAGFTTVRGHVVAGVTSGSGTLRWGIYTVGTNGHPATLMYDFGAAALTTGIADVFTSASVALAAGAYVMCFVSTDATARVRAFHDGNPNPRYWFGSGDAFTSSPRAGAYASYSGYTTGALPTTATTAGFTVHNTSAGVPFVAVES